MNIRDVRSPSVGAAPRASVVFGTSMQEGKKYQFKDEYRQKYPVPAKIEYHVRLYTNFFFTVLAAAITMHTSQCLLSEPRRTVREAASGAQGRVRSG